MRRSLPPLAAFALLGLACAGLKPAADQRGKRSAEGPPQPTPGARQEPTAGAQRGPAAGARPEDLTRDELAALLPGKDAAAVKRLLGGPSMVTVRNVGPGERGKLDPDSRDFAGRFQ